MSILSLFVIIFTRLRHAVLISSSWCQTWMSSCISCCFVVIFVFSSRRLTIAHKFSIGFMSGLFPGQGKTLISSSLKNSLILLAWCHGAPSCIKMNSPLGNQSRTCGSSLLLITSRYWSCLMVFQQCRAYQDHALI